MYQPQAGTSPRSQIPADLPVLGMSLQRPSGWQGGMWRNGTGNMSAEQINCVLLADRHHGLTEGIRGLLETMFEAVVMVADETSLQESAARLQPSVAVVDLALTWSDGLGVVRRLRARCPELKLILLSVHDEASACRATLEAGADAFVLKRAIATDLLPAINAVQAGKVFISPGVQETILPSGRPGNL